MEQKISKKAATATIWSGSATVCTKLVTPIITMILARLLTPEAYGVVATLAIIISFAEIFTDAGFQKYLIQHEFKDEEDLEQSTTVAFWSNLLLSMLLWIVIAIFNKPLAALVGSPGLGHVLIIACASIPLAAFSSIQSSLYRRSFDYKTLFKIRIIGILIPLLVTLPLAIIFRNFWALVLSTIIENIINAALLTYFSKWKPRLYFSFDKLKEMFSFSVWSMFEAITIWLTGYIDMFIIGTALSAYYLGVYRTSINIVSQIMALITATTTPILFSALSRLQNDESEFQRLFFKFQKLVGLLVIPIGVGLFIFSDLATKIVLGDQWSEASGVIGIWGLTSSIVIVLSHYSSEVYRAKGMPKISVVAQILHLVVLCPTVVIASNYSFEVLYTARSLVRFEGILVHLCLMGFIIKMPIGKMLTNVIPSCFAATCMSLILLLPSMDTVLINILYVLIAVVIYLGVVLLFPDERNTIVNLPKLLKKK